MAGADTHYEVFYKKHKKAEWSLAEAREDRADALAIAEQLRAHQPSASVRVTREDYDTEHRAFRSVTIFESGPERFAETKPKEEEARLPCLTPDDLAGPAARETMRRVLSGWLERQQICPMELLHRPDMIARLDCADNDLQHAIQKVAVARAQAGDGGVHAYVRLITELVQKGIDEAAREARRAKASPPGRFAETAAKIHAEGSREKRLRSAIAQELSALSAMADKAACVLDMLDDLPEDPAAAQFAEAQADAFLAEILSFDSAIRAFLGSPRDHGEEVKRLSAIYEGRANASDLDDAPDAPRRLAARLKASRLPGTRAELAARILSALRSPKRFKPKSVMEEIALARALAMRLIAVSGADLHPDALVEAFTHRSARLLAPEAVEEALCGAADPGEELDRLFQMEDNLVGESNKAKLASYVRAKLGSNGCEAYFCRGQGQPLERLARLTRLQARARSGTFPETDKAEMAAAFDALGLKILDASKIIDRIAGSDQPALKRAAALLRLAVEGVLPEGRCRDAARSRALRLLGSTQGRSEAGRAAARPIMQHIQSLLDALKPEAEEAGPAEDAAENEDDAQDTEAQNDAGNASPKAMTGAA